MMQVGVTLIRLLGIKTVKLKFTLTVEIIEYLGRPIHYNSDQLQRAGQVDCGHLWP